MNSSTILIPVHNRRALTLGCLEALHANGDLLANRVVVIDDGSSDSTAEAVRAGFPSVEILPGNGSLFWTGAIRLAMARRRERGESGSVIWLNDDCRPRPGALARLNEWLSRHPAAIAGPTCIDAATRQPLPTGFSGRRIFSAGPGEERRVSGVSGFCVGIGAKAAAELDLPDAERFPHYAGDTAYTLKASRRGHPVVLLGDVIVDVVERPTGSGTLDTRVDASASWRTNWQGTFSATQSPYRLRTMVALLRLKYGAALGTPLAMLRAVDWIVRLVRAKLRRRLPPNVPR